MTPHRRRSWTWFVATAAVLLLVLAWLTATLLRLDRDEVEARRQAELHEKLRLGLWRMDSWLSPQLAREAMRPASDYRAFAPATAWTRGDDRLRPNAVLVPSPLLTFSSPVLQLHFELGADGAASSPQAPTGDERAAAESNGVMPAAIERAGARLLALRPWLSFAACAQRLRREEALLPALGCNTYPPDASVQTQQSVAEYGNRQRTNAQNVYQGQPERGAAPGVADAATSTGPMLPLWLDGPGAPLLAFARRVRAGGQERIQGVAVDWPALQQQLLALVPDLFAPDATAIVRCEQPTPAEQATMLATVPARLQAALLAPAPASALPTAAILLCTWSAALLALVALAVTLRAAIGFGERRARFASAVTHELRTPLTTFRMYSEMLADGVVSEPGAQREYLQTLQRESDRLARVVENVLAWSRLEEGRFAGRRERHALPSLLARVAPALHRRLAEAAMTLALELDADARDAVLATDEDAIGQILFNLVDNAAKYARGAADPVVHLRARAAGAAVRIEVRDHGPGVAAAHRERIFAPFDRGAVATASNEIPGVGLGLSLARGLARDLGGELLLDAAVDGGACFVLTLPVG